jgi:hypothetical protein
MRFITVVKSAETNGPPPQALMDAIGKLGEEATRDGSLLQMGGLFPSMAGSRVRIASGKLVVTDGPFSEAREIIGGFALFELPSKEAAVEAATKFMELHRLHWPGWEGESEVRQIF